MAFLTLYREKLRHNFQYLDTLFTDRGLQWAAVSKLLCGTESYLREMVNLGIREICDSRISNLKKLKKIDPTIRTIYIKPPAKRSIKSIVQYADVSMNTEYYTLKLLSEEAQRQEKTHEAIIMIETGDLREGVMGDNLIAFYEKVFELPNIEIIGLGTNLNCLHGVMPSPDKLVQLCLYKQIIELKFNRQIPFISGGTSVTIPLIFHHQLPAGVNHFRIGETLFFGVDLFEEKVIQGMKGDVFELAAEIIEITEKPVVPIGEMAANPSGEEFEVNEDDYGRMSYRAILDIGLLDIDPKFLIMNEETHPFEIVGASSDMLVLDLGTNERNLKVGDLVKFQLKYMGALGLLNSSYIEKRIE